MSAILGVLVGGFARDTLCAHATHWLADRLVAVCNSDTLTLTLARWRLAEPLACMFVCLIFAWCQVVAIVVLLCLVRAQVGACTPLVLGHFAVSGLILEMSCLCCSMCSVEAHPCLFFHACMQCKMQRTHISGFTPTVKPDCSSFDVAATQWSASSALQRNPLMCHYQC